MKIGSLFAGIGGLELGLEAAIPGAHTVWQEAWERGVARTVEPRSVPHRAARLRALGNAVVPQCAFEVGCRINSLIALDA